jgi:DUF2993 family protein
VLPGLVALGVAVGVAAIIAADRLLAAVAIRRIARGVALASHARVAPQVRIGGPVFLTQLLAGVYREVEVMLGACTLGGVDFAELSVQLTRVRAPVRQLLAGHPATAGQLTATGMIPYSVLSDRLPPGLTIRPRGGDLRISGTILGVPALGIVSVSAETEKIRITPKLAGLPSLVGFVIELPAMPPQVRIASVRVTEGGLEVACRGADLPLASAK